MKSVVVLIEEDSPGENIDDICSRVFKSEQDAFDLYHELVKALNDTTESGEE